MATVRLPTVFQRQHQNRIAALAALMVKYEQAGERSSTRVPPRPATTSRPGMAVRVTSRDGVRVFESINAAARFMKCAVSTVAYVLPPVGDGKWRGWQLERV
jgi:hypothetical protein